MNPLLLKPERLPEETKREYHERLAFGRQQVLRQTKPESARFMPRLFPNRKS